MARRACSKGECLKSWLFASQSQQHYYSFEPRSNDPTAVPAEVFVGAERGATPQPHSKELGLLEFNIASLIQRELFLKLNLTLLEEG
jgi:hypothetical protein